MVVTKDELFKKINVSVTHFKEECCYTIFKLLFLYRCYVIADVNDSPRNIFVVPRN